MEEKQGLIAGARAAGGAQRPDMQPAPAGDAGETSGVDRDTTPEEQAAYTDMVDAATVILFHEKTMPGVLQMLQAESSPEQAIANVTVHLVTTIDDEAGNKIPDEVILAPVEEIVEQTGELAQENQIFQVDEAVLNGAAQRALLSLGESYGIDQADIEQFINELDPKMVDDMRKQQAAYGEGSPSTQQVAARGGQQQVPPGGV